MTVSPVWVICAFEDEEFKQLEAKLQRQFKAISYNEVDTDFKETSKKWWKITNIGENTKKILDNHVDEKGHPSDVPAFDAITTFDLYKFTVVYFASADKFASLFTIAKELQKAHKNGKLLNGTQMLRYGLCVVSKGEPLPTNLKTKIKAFVKDEEPVFDKLLFQGDLNKGAGNRLGYDALLEKGATLSPRHNIHDLSVQIISHLALSRDKVNDIQHNDRLQTVGAFSLTFEKEVEKASHATKIMKPLFERFCTEKEDERWRYEQDAVIPMGIKDARSWEGVYSALSSGFRDEEIKDVYPKGEDGLSPWTLVSKYMKYMIPLYFKKYIRSFVKILHRNVEEVTTNSFVSYGLTLENNYFRLTKAHAVEHEIREELMSVWDKENVDGAIGLQQCDLLLDKTSAFYEDQKKAINRMQKGEAPDKKHMNFPSPNDFPMKRLGKFYDSFEKYWKKGKNVEERKNISSDSYGNNLLEKLIKVLKYHPIPLSLFARSVLTALSLPFAVYILLRLIPDEVIDTRILEEGVGKWILGGGIFALCILWGVFKYGKLVLGKIKSYAYDYIGWFIYKTQKLMFDETLQKADKYYELCLNVCDQYKKNIQSFAAASAPLKEMNREGYEQTMFQCDITKTFRFSIDNSGTNNGIIEPKVVREGSVMPKANIVYRQDYRDKKEIKAIIYEKEEEMNQLYVDLTRSIINFDTKKDVHNALKEGLFPIALDAENAVISEKEDERNEYWEKVKSGISELMMEKITGSIELFVGRGINANRVASDISDIAFGCSNNLGVSNQVNHYNFAGPVTDMRDVTGDIYTNTLITSRLQPSAQVETESSSHISIVCPAFNDYGLKEWSDCFFKGMDYQTSVTEGAIGMVNILSVVTFKDIEGLSL